jgi:hypothetical protein
MEGYWKLKMKALDCTLWRTCFGRSYEPVVWQTRKQVNEWCMLFLLSRNQSQSNTPIILFCIKILPSMKMWFHYGFRCADYESEAQNFLSRAVFRKNRFYWRKR